MFASFDSFEFFNFVVTNFIISKNLKTLKVSENNRLKIFKVLTSEDMKNETLPEILRSFYRKI